MNKYENVECKRCGNQWYSEKFEEEGELPESCPKCYQDEVRKIPEPPTAVDKMEEEIEQKKKEIPQKAKQKKHDLIIWKENNRFLISMLKMAALLFILVAAVVYMLFLR